MCRAALAELRAHRGALAFGADFPLLVGSAGHEDGGAGDDRGRRRGPELAVAGGSGRDGARRPDGSERGPTERRRRRHDGPDGRRGRARAGVRALCPGLASRGAARRRHRLRPDGQLPPPLPGPGTGHARGDRGGHLPARRRSRRGPGHRRGLRRHRPRRAVPVPPRAVRRRAWAGARIPRPRRLRRACRRGPATRATGRRVRAQLPGRRGQGARRAATRVVGGARCAGGAVGRGVVAGAHGPGPARRRLGPPSAGAVGGRGMPGTCLPARPGAVCRFGRRWGRLPGPRTGGRTRAEEHDDPIPRQRHPVGRALAPPGAVPGAGGPGRLRPRCRRRVPGTPVALLLRNDPVFLEVTAGHRPARRHPHARQLALAGRRGRLPARRLRRQGAGHPRRPAGRRGRA